MKKVILLCLCLMLCLPMLAMAETAEAKRYTVDFGTFTMSLGENDQYQVAETMTNNKVYAIIYTDYDPSALLHDSINVVWSTDDVPGEIAMVGGIQKYAELILQNAHTQYTTMGIKMTDAKVINAAFEDSEGATLTYCVMDYTAAGVDLVTPLYQMQLFVCDAEDGNYIFTLSSTTLDGLEKLLAYTENIDFKE